MLMVAKLTKCKRTLTALVMAASSETFAYQPMSLHRSK